jgi:hypothetical protein
METWRSYCHWLLKYRKPNSSAPFSPRCDRYYLWRGCASWGYTAALALQAWNCCIFYRSRFPVPRFHEQHVIILYTKWNKHLPLERTCHDLVQPKVIHIFATCYFIITKFMEQSPSWEADSYSISLEIPCFYENLMFITVFKGAWWWSLSWVR